METAAKPNMDNFYFEIEVCNLNFSLPLNF